MLKVNLDHRRNVPQSKNGPDVYDPYAPSLLASFRPAPELNDGHIHLWTISKGTRTVSDYVPLLSRHELNRASGMRSQQLFDRFVADHGALRLLLSAYLETDPRTLQIDVNKYGKPHIDIPHCRLRFNMSHSGEITMIAVCLDAEVGVDVEAVRPIAEWEEIAASHFSSQENESLRAEGSRTRVYAFFRCWTRKEAFIKAIGMGLSLPLDSFTVTTTMTEPPALLHCAWDPEAVLRWSLIHLEPANGHVGAVAVKGTDWSVQHFTWP
jgi:4'-phosphopantetheinyl transferase